MDHIIADAISEAVERIRRQDSTLQWVYLSNKKYTDEKLTELVECLLSYPNIITELWLSNNHLTDKTGVKLARYVATSTTIQRLFLYDNHFSDTTYLAMANALRLNSSLEYLCLYTDIKDQIEVSLVDALMINPNRPITSYWPTLDWDVRNYQKLKAKAEQLGHPNMQSLLATSLLRTELMVY